MFFENKHIFWNEWINETQGSRPKQNSNIRMEWRWYGMGLCALSVRFWGWDEEYTGAPVKEVSKMHNFAKSLFLIILLPTLFDHLMKDSRVLFLYFVWLHGFAFAKSGSVEKFEILFRVWNFREQSLIEYFRYFDLIKSNLKLV